MKRVLSIILTVLMIISMSACSIVYDGTNSTATRTVNTTVTTTQDNRIALTMKNYSQYLSVDASAYYGSGGIWTSGLYLQAEVTPDTTNFNFYDVKLKVQVVGTTYLSDGQRRFTEDMTIKLNIGGNGKQSVYKLFGGQEYTISLGNIRVIYNVLDVSGYVEPA